MLTKEQFELFQEQRKLGLVFELTNGRKNFKRKNEDKILKGYEKIMWLVTKARNLK